MLDTEPDVAAAVAKDSADDHRLGGARRGYQHCGAVFRRG